MLLTALPPAEAAPARRAKATATAIAPAPAPVQTTSLASEPLKSVTQGGPLVAAISLASQSLTIYSGTTIVARSPISSGMSGYATPTGVFSIIQKNRYHESNIYNNAPMPFMQRLTWSGVALHAGKLPGYPASHGCVRLPYDVAERLFGMLKMGTRVIVAPEAIVPEPIVHAALPRPIMTPVSLIATTQPAPGVTLASTAAPTSVTLTEQLLNPPQWAEHEKRRAARTLLDAQQEARRALELAAAAVSDADATADERRQIERDLASFNGLLERARQRHAKALDDEERIQAEASVLAFEEAIGDATAARDATHRTEAQRRDATFVEARRARDAEDAVDRAENAARISARGGDPITIFVSRTERKVQVRQGFQTILEGNVDIRDAHAPLGTHVLTAGPVADIATGPMWTSVSVSDGNTGRHSAQAALDRIVMEPGIAHEIGRRLWTGATFLISDQPASRETGKGTDFVILTK